MTTDTLPRTKVTATQRAKLAYVYVRQSSLNQVRRHGESTDMQYQLVERAVHLGWPRDRVHLVDDDLGKSAVSAEHRQGFQFLMTEIGLGRVGLVMSLDASRLSRNNSDWYRLIELCSMFGVLIADGEQLYDPRAYHDRLLLGLSGMMSEAELHHLKVRLQAVVYPNPADNSISAKTGKTAMNSATSSCHMAQGHALARFHRVRGSSA
jgi:DNA invertase Pin-like site-specific DNA recombinase